MDAIHYHVRSEGQIVKKAVYIAIGINLEGKKSVLGMWVGENESAKFWASVLNNLKNRKVEDILIACTDNLTGFSEAIAAVFPKTDMQNTSNKKKYILRLYIANILIALSSLLFVATNILIDAPSMLSTYLYVVIYILLFEKIYNKNENKRISVKCKLYYITLAIFVTILPIIIDKYIFSTLCGTISSMFGSSAARCARVIFRTLLPNLINVDYSVLFVILGVILYFTNKYMSAIFLALFSGLSLVGNTLFTCSNARFFD